MKIKTLLAAAVAVASLATPVCAASFRAHPSGKSLVMTGDIVAGDAARFVDAVKAQNRRGVRVERMFMNSPGGELAAGWALAKSFRQIGDIDAVIGRTDRCVSMCAIVFAATSGVVDPGGRSLGSRRRGRP